jgi:hypothetical protein
MSEPLPGALADGDDLTVERPQTALQVRTGIRVEIPAVKRNKRTGRLVIENPSPLRDMPPKERERWLVGFLEACAVAGDASAAKDVLSHTRWKREMAEGRAPQRHEVHASGAVTIVDDVSGPGDVAGLSELLALGDPGKAAVKALLQAVIEGRDLRGAMVPQPKTIDVPAVEAESKPPPPPPQPRKSGRFARPAPPPPPPPPQPPRGAADESKERVSRLLERAERRRVAVDAGRAKE